MELFHNSWSRAPISAPVPLLGSCSINCGTILTLFHFVLVFLDAAETSSDIRSPSTSGATTGPKNPGYGRWGWHSRGMAFWRLTQKNGWTKSNQPMANGLDNCWGGKKSEGGGGNSGRGWKNKVGGKNIKKGSWRPGEWHFASFCHCPLRMPYPSAVHTNGLISVHSTLTRVWCVYCEHLTYQYIYLLLACEHVFSVYNGFWCMLFSLFPITLLCYVN